MSIAEHMKFAVSALILINLISLGRTFAAELSRLQDPIIINASRIPTSLESSIASVVVMDRQTIEDSQASSVTELLRQEAGVHIQQNGSRGAIGSVYLRNNDPNFVTVIIDGVKVNDPTNSRGGSFDFSSIDLNAIERIEIVKGSMSSIHGSDALSGVIYITTRPVKEKAETRARLTAGTRDFREATAQVQQRVSNTDMSLNMAYVDEGEQVDFSGFINRSVNVSSDSYIGNGRKISFRGRYNESDARSLPDDSGGVDYAVIRESEKRQIRESSLGLTYSHDVSADVSFKIIANTFVHDERDDSPGVAPGVRDPFGIPANSSDSELTRHYLSWNNNFVISPNMQISAGLDLQREYGNSDSVLDTGFGLLAGSYYLKRSNHAAFMEALFKHGEKFSAKLGVRYDMPTGFSRQTTANLGVQYIVDHYIVSASVGNGFKLPSFYALGNPIVGNPDLHPEKSIFRELGIKQISADQSFQWHFNIYSYEFEDLVDFDAGPPPALVNRSKVTSDGAEAGIRQNISKANSVSLDLAYSVTDIVGTSEHLRNRPRWKATGQYIHHFSDNLTTGTTLVYVDEVYESSIATGDVILDAYTRLDVSMNWQYNKMWSFGGVVENLSNETYQETVGTDSPGTTLRISLSAKM